MNSACPQPRHLWFVLTDHSTSLYYWCTCKWGPSHVPGLWDEEIKPGGSTSLLENFITCKKCFLFCGSKHAYYVQYLHTVFLDMILVELYPGLFVLFIETSVFLLLLFFLYTIRLHSRSDRTVQISLSMDLGKLLLFNRAATLGMM